MTSNLTLHAIKTEIAERFESIQRVLADGTTEKVVLSDKYRTAVSEVQKQLDRIGVGLERLDAADNPDDFDTVANRIIEIVQHDLSGALVTLAKTYAVAVRQAANF